MPLNRWLLLQLTYLALAIGFNLVSIWLEQTTGKSLIEGSTPMRSIVLLVVLLSPTLWLGLRKKYTAYAVINFLLTLMLLQIGVLKHVYAYLDDGLWLYSSTVTWFAAIAINTFGVAMAVSGSISALIERRRNAVGKV